MSDEPKLALIKVVWHVFKYYGYSPVWTIREWRKAHRNFTPRPPDFLGFEATPARDFFSAAAKRAYRESARAHPLTSTKEQDNA